jgi:hypothetical protein
MNWLRRLFRRESRDATPTIRIESMEHLNVWLWKLYNSEGTLICIGEEGYRCERAARRGARRFLSMMRRAVLI